MVKTVLSVDDDDVTQILNNLYLESFEFCEKIIMAANGIEALEIFKKLENGDEPMAHFPEIIFLDLNMPLMDGWEFYDAFLNDFPQYLEKTKIFILSSSINPSDVQRAKNEKNIISFLSKPLNEDKLREVKSLLEY